jgi:hypothetical protein
MNQNQTSPKPTDAEQEIGKGLDETPCSALDYGARCVILGGKLVTLNLGLTWLYSPHAELDGMSPRDACDAGRLEEVEAIIQRIEDAPKPCPECYGSGYEEIDHGHYPCRCGCLPNA